ncbi:MAG: tetratricopeptide repeat protein [Deltaproteobacteria bacterium]|nr:tetratricopeptide repeat protein [Deltaproteobacteria bacterium]
MLDPAKLFNQALTALERGDRALAKDRLGKVLAARPDDVEAALVLARALRDDELPDSTAAREAAEAVLVAAIKAAAQGPADPTEALLELADLRLSLGRPADAARACRRVLEVKPNDWEALYLLGNAFLDVGAWAEAARSYREALATNPFDAEIWWNLGVALERTGDAVGAAEAYSTHARLAADGADTHVTRE